MAKTGLNSTVKLRSLLVALGWGVVYLVCGLGFPGLSITNSYGGNVMTRVLSTEEAKTAIRQIQSIVNGGFADQITQLDSQGRILSDANVWDGPLASQFRGSVWPETKSALDKAKQQLDELRAQLDTISQNIFSAGGGS